MGPGADPRAVQTQIVYLRELRAASRNPGRLASAVTYALASV
jgi:hypothetical protein